MCDKTPTTESRTEREPCGECFDTGHYIDEGMDPASGESYFVETNYPCPACQGVQAFRIARGPLTFTHEAVAA